MPSSTCVTHLETYKPTYIPNATPRILNPKTPPPHHHPHTMKPTALLHLGLLAAATKTATSFANSTSLTSCLSDAVVPFITPSSDDWPLLSTSFNTRLPYTPLTIVIPRSTSHIIGAVRCGVAAGVKVTPKAGGHSYAALGLGGEDGHMVVEMEHMTAVSLDLETGIATVQPGARLGDIAIEIFREGARAFSHGTCLG